MFTSFEILQHSLHPNVLEYNLDSLNDDVIIYWTKSLDEF